MEFKLNTTRLEAMSRSRREKIISYKFKIEAEKVFNALRVIAKPIVEGGGNVYQETREYGDNLRKISEWLTNPNTKLGLMIGGTFGNGKTVTLKAIKELMKQCVLTPENTGIWNHGNLLFKAKELVEDVELMEKAKKITWLLIDELGEEPTVVKTWGNSTTPIIELLEYRYENELPTIVTTNLNGNEIAHKYMGRVDDRIHGMYDTIIYTDKSFRRQ